MSSLDYASTVRMVNMSVTTPTLKLPFHSDPTLLAMSSDPSLVYIKGFWLALTTLHIASAIYATLLSSHVPLPGTRSIAQKGNFTIGLPTQTCLAGFRPGYQDSGMYNKNIR